MIEIKHDEITLEFPKDTDYGLSQLNPALGTIPQVMRELWAYKLTHGKYGEMQRKKLGITPDKFSFKSPLQHMVNCCLFFWPDEFLLQSCGIRNNYALDVLWCLCNSRDIGIAGAASTGKTFTIAAWAVADWMCAPNATSTFVASTSLDAAEDRLWGKVAQLYRTAMKRAQATWGKEAKLGTLIDYRKCIAYGDIISKDEERDYSNSIKALAFKKGEEGKKAIETCRGRKNSRVRLLVDELAEMDLYVLDARVNLRSNPDFMFAGAANPAATMSNPHTELCQPDDPRQWESVDIRSHCWKTRTGLALHLNGEDSPNFRAPDGLIPFERYLTHERKAEVLELCLGSENHQEYWRNVYGWWPDASVELTVMTRSFIAQSGLNVEPRWRELPKVVCGFDTGFTAGGDRCVQSFQKVGMDETGRKVAFFLGTKVVFAEVGEVFEESVARKVVKNCIDSGVDPRDFGMDISSDGGKMLRAIILEWQKFDPLGAHIFPISSMGKPTEKPVSAQDLRKAIDVYDRLVTEYWFNVLTGFITKSLYGLDLNQHRTLVDELCARIYFHKGNKVSVETKSDMKERIKKSPDEADSYVYSVFMARRAGVSFSTGETYEDQTEREIRDFERRIIYKKQDEPEDEMFSYSGSGADPDGF